MLNTTFSQAQADIHQLWSTSHKLRAVLASVVLVLGLTIVLTFSLPLTGLSFWRVGRI